jgi:uncharacterized protein YndB with AHSA1/START domain
MDPHEETITISAPLNRVFEYVSDFTKHGEWAGNNLSAEKVGAGPVGVGTQYKTTAKQFGTQREQSTITQIDAPKTFEWDSVGALGKAHHWFHLSESGGATTVAKGGQMVEPKFLAKLMSRKLAKDMPAGFRRDLANIKAKLEP